MTFSPRSDWGPLISLGGTLALFAIGGIVIRGAFSIGIGPASFVLLMLGLAVMLSGVVGLLYTLSFALLSYKLDRNGLVISAGLINIVVPMNSITAIYGAPTTPLKAPFRGLLFRGHTVGLQSGPEGKNILYLATTPRSDCLYVATDSRIYAISPESPEDFRRACQFAQSLGPIHRWHESATVAAILQTLVRRYRLIVSLTAATFLAVILLVGLVFWQYPSLPELVPMHFDALGQADRLAPPQAIFYLPLMGSIVAVLNSILAIILWHKERLLSYFLWGGAILVQVLLIRALGLIVAYH